MILTQKLKHKKREGPKSQNAKQTKLRTNEEVVRAFKEKAKLGIDYSCCCCDRLLFQNQVQRCERKMKKQKMLLHYAFRINIATRALSNVHKIALSQSYGFVIHVTGKFRMVTIWTTESAANKMTLEDIPKELKQLNNLERHLTAIHIPFMKVIALSHGGQQNIHGPVV